MWLSPDQVTIIYTYFSQPLIVLRAIFRMRARYCIRSLTGREAFRASCGGSLSVYLRGKVNMSLSLSVTWSRRLLTIWRPAIVWPSDRKWRIDSCRHRWVLKAWSDSIASVGSLSIRWFLVSPPYPRRRDGDYTSTGELRLT